MHLPVKVALQTEVALGFPGQIGSDKAEDLGGQTGFGVETGEFILKTQAFKV